MSARIGAAQQALCYFYRNPPPSSGVRPQPYKEIAKLIGQPQLPAGSIRTIVRRFHLARQVRGRKKGWRKTTAAEDARIFACFQKVRRPLGSLVESQDVWKALPATLRDKVTARTVANRLREKGYSMKGKLAGDDLGEQWRQRRLKFCKTHQRRTAPQWARYVQAVADFRYFVYYPRGMKARYASKSAPRTIMHNREKKKAPFLKPKKAIFKRTEYKRARKAKVFGVTTSAECDPAPPGESCLGHWRRHRRHTCEPHRADAFVDSD